MEEAQQQFMMKCKRHQDKDVDFIQVNDLKDDQEDIFYCSECLTESQLNPNNFANVKQILNENDDSVLNNFPPLDEKNEFQTQIKAIKQIQQLNQVAKMNESFEILKTYMCRVFEEYQKQMIDRTVEASKMNERILQKYQEVTKLKELKEMLQINNNNQDIKQQQCQDFIKNIHKQKESNKKVFEELLSEKKQIETNAKLDKFKEIEQKVYNVLDSLNNVYVPENKPAVAVNYVKDLMPDLQFIKYLHAQEKSKNITVGKDPITNEFTFISDESNQYGSFYTNFILKSDKKYTFRLKANQIQQQKVNYLVFGLVRDETKDSFACTKDYLSCSFCYTNNLYTLSQYAKGLSTLVKGSFHQIPQNTEIELSVSIDEGILEVTDYPKRNHKIVLKNENKPNLNLYKNLRFFIGMENKLRVTLISALEQ